MGTRVEAWPGLCLETPCLRLSVSAQISGFWGWVGFSGNRALLWVGFPGPPGGQCCSRAPSLSPARFTFPGAPGDPSGGPPGNHSNVPAHSGWVGRQVHLVNLFQGTGIGHKVNGQQWGCCCALLPVHSLLRREQSCPSSFSPVLLFSQHLSGTRKTEPARTKVVCSPLAWAFKPAKDHTEPKWKQKGPDFSGTIEGRRDQP